jgi:bifunctional non-homologous end joining protein LigD
MAALIFGGKAGTGFGLAAGRELAERLAKIERDTPPFASVPRAYQPGTRCVEPRLVAEVTFTQPGPPTTFSATRVSKASAKTSRRGR